MKDNTSARGRLRGRFLRVVVVSAALAGAVGVGNAPVADALVYVGGNTVETGGACGLGPIALYRVAGTNFGNAQEVRLYTQVYGGATTVTVWEKAAPALTIGVLGNGLPPGTPKGAWYRHYVEYREWNIARYAQTGGNGWYTGGEYVTKAEGQWCRA